MVPLTALLRSPTKVELPWGQPPIGVEVLWRVEAKRYSYVVDADADIYGVTDPVLELHWYRVRHWTKGGNARLENGKLVLFDKFITRRRWACRTPEEALASLIARRRRQERILLGQLQGVRAELAMAEAAELPAIEPREEHPGEFRYG